MAATGTLETRLALNWVDQIITLNLIGQDGITGHIGKNVFDHVVPELLALADRMPFVVVEIARRPVFEGDGGTFEDRRINYMLRCWIVDHFRENYQQVQQVYTDWNEQIAETAEGLVKYPLLPDCPELMTIEPGDQVVLQEQAAREQPAKGYVDLNCHCYRKRKRNA